MINVRDELRRGGVAGLLKATGLEGDEASMAQAKECGSGFARFWVGCTDPLVMFVVAARVGVPAPELVRAAQAVVEGLVYETGITEQLDRTTEVLQLVAAALVDVDGHYHAEKLTAASLLAVPELGGDGEHPVGEMPWQKIALASVVLLAQATIAVVCPCGQPHGGDLQHSVMGSLRAAARARVAHGTAVGRVPPSVPSGQEMRWADEWNANYVRNALPAEMVVADRMVTIPQLTLEGKVIHTQRKRGQA